MPEFEAEVLEQIEEMLNIHFQNPALVRLALTHRSYIYETPGLGQSSNERLEFLGDAILALVSSDFLYNTFPDLSEGDLSNVRAALVKMETLANFAEELHLEHFLLRGKGDQNTSAGQRVMASTFEAIVGAIYLDQGLEMVQHFLLSRLEPLAEQIVQKRLFKDNKSLFQELAQARKGITPAYRLVSQEGPSHHREFTAEVLLGDEVMGKGQGRNKQSAEQEAAHAALEKHEWL